MCQYAIPWYRNLPILTWIIQRGRCANCKAPIPFYYIGVELAFALLFSISVLLSWKLQAAFLLGALAVYPYFLWQRQKVSSKYTTLWITVSFGLSILFGLSHAL